ncbi:MAG: hypothetical protein M1828_000663 [Chrysothrix sp. TS-e1954]|nr:MAG: hypothetical protein M1828_000663 [Chrysothrix sp. TS-e1954]
MPTKRPPPSRQSSVQSNKRRRQDHAKSCRSAATKKTSDPVQSFTSVNNTITSSAALSSACEDDLTQNFDQLGSLPSLENADGLSQESSNNVGRAQGQQKSDVTSVIAEKHEPNGRSKAAVPKNQLEQHDSTKKTHKVARRGDSTQTEGLPKQAFNQFGVTKPGLECQQTLDLFEAGLDFSDSASSDDFAGAPRAADGSSHLSCTSKTALGVMGTKQHTRQQANTSSAHTRLEQHFNPMDHPISEQQFRAGSELSTCATLKYGPWDSPGGEMRGFESSYPMYALGPALPDRETVEEAGDGVLSNALPYNPDWPTSCTDDDHVLAYDPDRGLILASSSDGPNGAVPRAVTLPHDSLLSPHQELELDAELDDEDLVDIANHESFPKVQILGSPWTPEIKKQEKQSGTAETPNKQLSSGHRETKNAQDSFWMDIEDDLWLDHLQLRHSLEDVSSSAASEASCDVRPQDVELHSRQNQSSPSECETRTLGAEDCIPSASVSSARPPIIRAPFPKLARDRSPVLGLTSSISLRVCFRLGQALNVGCQAVRCSRDVVLELYARVLASDRDVVSGKQSFTFADLYHSEHPPHLHGIYQGWKGVELWEYDSRIFLGEEGKGRICRCIGRIQRDGRHWMLEVMSIWQASWDDVEYVQGILSV